MPPKFQSSFIPKGPATSMANSSSGVRRAESRDLFSTLAWSLFVVSVVAALGVFLYNIYLNYSIGVMDAELEQARATLAPETITELTRLNSRLSSTQELLDKHKVLSPLFEYLETATLNSVRFTQFTYSQSEAGPQLVLAGQANGYAALALQADIFNQSPYLDKPSFSDLSLSQQGNVVFSMTTGLKPAIISYSNLVDSQFVPVVPVTTPAATSSAATSTNPTQATSTSTSSGQATPN